MLFCIRLSFSLSLNLPFSYCNAYTGMWFFFPVFLNWCWRYNDADADVVQGAKRRLRIWMVSAHFYLAALSMHCMQRDLVTIKLSVRLAVCQTRDLRQNKRNMCPHSYTAWKSITLVLWHEEWLVGATPSTWNFGSNWLRWSENADFQSIFARSDSAVTPAEKSSVNTNRKSTTRFSTSLR